MAKNKGGRPPAKIDQSAFEGLCELQCTKLEICGWFRVTDKTLENWCKRTYGKGFSEVFKEKRGLGLISLRRNQFQLAEKNAAMGIWLGKQYLGQRDVVETHDGTKESEIEKLARQLLGGEDKKDD